MLLSSHVVAGNGIYWLKESNPTSRMEEFYVSLSKRVALNDVSISEVDRLCGSAEVATIIVSKAQALEYISDVFKGRECKAQFLSVLFSAGRYSSIDMGVLKTRHIAIEQPLMHQVSYASEHKQYIKRLGVLYSKRDDPVEIGMIKAMYKHKNLELVFRLTDDGSSSVEALKEVIKVVDGIVVSPQSKLITPTYIKPLLIATIRQRIPVFGGLSPGFVKSGFSGGWYSTNESISDTVVKVINKFEDALPVEYAEKPVLVVNERVSRHLRMQMKRPTSP
ncbi:hypothetical protein [Neptuniibacter sp. QD37_11]|uniref:hypothetical protein n=1 Tax=Neptuniibacter sp. QD37_11 TaxID=3398209 RepID=UPI0039F4B263